VEENLKVKLVFVIINLEFMRKIAITISQIYLKA